MAQNDLALVTAITRILRQPDIDLDVVSAKQVREKLLEAGHISADEAEKRWKEIKDVVGETFWVVKESKESQTAKETMASSSGAPTSRQ